MTAYEQFLQSKQLVAPSAGFEPKAEFPRQMFDFQKDVVRWGLRRGRAAFFEDCGLGKTAQELTWGFHVYAYTGENVLLLTPLAVADQTVRESVKFSIPCVKHCEDQSHVEPGISVTNYERLHRFDLSKFAGLILDESSILKSQDGHYRTKLIESAKHIPYRLAGTATPAPNDIMEIGNHAEFLGVMSRAEMLATFFCHDGGDTSKWRLKGHAERDFWRWMCSWAVNIRKPSDLGYNDGGFVLPKLNIQHVTVQTNCKSVGMLFPLPASSLSERREVRRGSLSDRVKASAELANSNSEQWLVWCNLNDESKALTEAINAAVEVTGSDSDDHKSSAMLDFAAGKIRVLVSKPDLCGFGMNWQQSHNMVFCGLSDSYEQLYQAVRRQYRFGQTQAVNVYVVTSDLESAVVSNIKRKQEDAERMASEMVRHMADISSAEIKGITRQTSPYNPQKKLELPTWLQAA